MLVFFIHIIHLSDKYSIHVQGLQNKWIANLSVKSYLQSPCTQRSNVWWPYPHFLWFCPISVNQIIPSSIPKNFISNKFISNPLHISLKFKHFAAQACTILLRVTYLCHVLPCDLFARRELLPHAPDHRCEHLQQGPDLDDAILWDGDLLVRVGLITTAIGQVLKQTNKSGFITDVTGKSIVF